MCVEASARRACDPPNQPQLAVISPSDGAIARARRTPRTRRTHHERESHLCSVGEGSAAPHRQVLQRAAEALVAAAAARAAATAATAAAEAKDALAAAAAAAIVSRRDPRVHMVKERAGEILEDLCRVQDMEVYHDVRHARLLESGGCVLVGDGEDSADVVY